jgi:hypothetical protein
MDGAPHLAGRSPSNVNHKTGMDFLQGEFFSALGRWRFLMRSRVPLWSPPDSPAECALQMIGRYKTREAAIQQAHAYDVDASADQERAHWRAILRKLRAPEPSQALCGESPSVTAAL